MFKHVEPYAGDPILSLNEAFQKDARPHKINLSIGIYFDDAGRIPVLESVRRAETQIVGANGPKPYQPIEGAANCRSAVQQLLFGAGHEAVASGRIATLQSVGSSGSLRVGAEFIHRYFRGERGLGQRPHLGQPPRDVRGCGPRGSHLPLLRQRDGRRALRRDARGVAQDPATQRRAAARLLSQPDRCRPDARSNGPR